ncbi:hypothetical protein BV20DRAFT_975224 [Pilatotrama ljubarskyi]|nr:hypothetical protein BV20DRAFT_975224 [Pilatotrama ljubarskyi]
MSLWDYVFGRREPPPPTCQSTQPASPHSTAEPAPLTPALVRTRQGIETAIDSMNELIACLLRCEREAHDAVPPLDASEIRPWREIAHEMTASLEYALVHALLNSSVGEDYIPTRSQLPRTMTPDEVETSLRLEKRFEDNVADLMGTLSKLRANAEKTERLVSIGERIRLFERRVLPTVRAASVLSLPVPALAAILAYMDVVVLTPCIGAFRLRYGDETQFSTLAMQIEMMKIFGQAVEDGCDEMLDTRQHLVEDREAFQRRLHDPATRYREVLLMQLFRTWDLAQAIFRFNISGTADETAPVSAENPKLPSIGTLASYLRDVANTFNGAIAVRGPLSSLGEAEWETLDKTLASVRSSPGQAIVHNILFPESKRFCAYLHV